MKKKHNFRGKLVFGTLLVFSIFVFTTDVYAKEKEKKINGNIMKYEMDDSGCDDQSKFPDANDRKKCHEKAKECDADLTTEVAGYNIKPNLVGNKFYYTIGKVTSISVGGVKVTNDGRNIKSGDPISTNLSSVRFSSTLKKDISFTSSTGQKIDMKCRGSYEEYHMYDVTTPTASAKITNTACKQNTGICWKYENRKKISTKLKGADKLNGTGVDDYSYSAMEKLGDVTIGGKKYNFLSYLKEKLPYCDCSKNAEVEYNLKNQDIVDGINLLAETFTINARVNGKIGTIKKYAVDTIQFDSDAILVDKTNLNNFTCTAFGPQTLDSKGNAVHKDKYEAVTDDKGNPITDSNGKNLIYNNYRKFAKKGPVKTVSYKTKKGEVLDVCEVQCGEQVEVSYGPPITAKAGICFEYIITVKSKIQCESKGLDKNIPKPPEVTTQNFTVCDVNVFCNTSAGFLKTQAGPNEDFDQCINEKFNGKYTQKAINYCYKKVYKKSDVTKVNSYLDEKITQKLATTCEWWNNETDLIKVRDGVATSDGKIHSIQDVVDKLYEYAVLNGKTSGTYVKRSAKLNGYNTYNWKPSKNACYWGRYADFYKTVNDNKNTISALVNDDAIFAKPKDSGGDCSQQGSSYCTRNLDNRLKIYRQANAYQGWSDATNIDALSHRYYYAGAANDTKGRVGIKIAMYVQGYSFPAESQSTAKTNQNGWWWGGSCNEGCYIYSTKANCVMPGEKTEQEVMKTGEWEEYRYNLKEYEKAIAQCSVEAKCAEDGNNKDKFVTTKETTYTMKANECTEIDSNGRCTKHTKMADESNVCKVTNREGTTCEVKDAEKCRYWSQTNGKDYKSRIQVKGEGHDSSIIINDNIGICYGDTSGNYHYINSISFPGYWTSGGKDGNEVNPKCSKTRLMDFQKNAYCVSPDLPSINKKWAIWDQGDKKKGIEPRGQITKVLTNGVDYKTEWDSVGKSYIKYIAPDAYYNIEGHFKNFGYLNWNLDFSCFYAINNTGGTTTTGDCDPNEKCCEEPCPRDKKDTIENVDTKTISLDDLFPGTDDTTKDMASSKNSDEIIPKKMNATTDDTVNVVKVAEESKGRTPGYNWSCDSASVKIKDPKNSANDYIIAPVSLRKKIEEKGTDVFNDSKELDYSITLTSDNMKEIRKFNKTKKNGYYDFSENISTDEANKELKAFTVDNDNNFTIRFFKSALLRNKGGNYVKKFSGNYNYCNNMKQNGDITTGASTNCDNLIEYRKGSTCEEERK